MFYVILSCVKVRVYYIVLTFWETVMASELQSMCLGSPAL